MMGNKLVAAIFSGKEDKVMACLETGEYTLNSAAFIDEGLGEEGIPPNYLHIALAADILKPKIFELLVANEASIDIANDLGSLLERIVRKLLVSPDDFRAIRDIITVLYRNGELIDERVCSILFDAYEALMDDDGKLKSEEDEPLRNSIIVVLRQLYTFILMSEFLGYVNNNNIFQASQFLKRPFKYAHPQWPNVVMFTAQFDPNFDAGVNGVPLFRAAELSKEMLLFLIDEVGVNLAYIGEKGETAFSCAIQKNKIENIKLIWDRLTPTQKKDIFYQPLSLTGSKIRKTPLDLANEQKNDELITLLSDYAEDLSGIPSKRRKLNGLAASELPLDNGPSNVSATALAVSQDSEDINALEIDAAYEEELRQFSLNSPFYQALRKPRVEEPKDAPQASSSLIWSGPSTRKKRLGTRSSLLQSIEENLDPRSPRPRTMQEILALIRNREFK